MKLKKYLFYPVLLLWIGTMFFLTYAAAVAMQ